MEIVCHKCLCVTFVTCFIVLKDITLSSAFFFHGIELLSAFKDKLQKRPNLYERTYIMKKILSLIIIAFIISLLFVSCRGKQKETASFNFSQIEKEQKIAVSWDSEYTIDKLEITVDHGGRVVSKTTFEGDILSDQKVEVDAYYGKHVLTVDAAFEGGGSMTVEKEIALSSDEYVIAPISGSMPQLYFTLNINEITKGGTVPAFVWLTRPDSWNWNKLPENVFAMPVVDIEEVLTHNNYNRMVEVTDAYIEELYSIDPNSKFNLYINDFNAYLYMKLMAGNGIPEDNYYVTLLSDGGASYAEFNNAFDSDHPDFDAYAKYLEMSAKLEALYAEVRETKDYYPSAKFTVDTSEFRQYPYVAAKEKDNVEWWILRAREGVLRSPDKDFINTVLNDDKTEGIIEERSFASPLAAMTEDEKETLRSFYNFKSETFQAAEQQGKRAMMILGSWANSENEPDFEAYVRFVKAYYGDEFVYYYKGHPNTPTSNHPHKQKQLEELGLIDVESSINAELILFFYPDIYMCGYDSSTFMSVERPEMACAMFNMKKENCTAEYKDLIGIYVSKLENSENSPYGELCREAEHDYFLAEFHNDTTVGADIAIYDDTDRKIDYYKIVNGEFVAVSE